MYHLLLKHIYLEKTQLEIFCFCSKGSFYEFLTCSKILNKSVAGSLSACVLLPADPMLCIYEVIYKFKSTTRVCELTPSYRSKITLFKNPVLIFKLRLEFMC